AKAYPRGGTGPGWRAVAAGGWHAWWQRRPAQAHPPDLTAAATVICVTVAGDDLIYTAMDVRPARCRPDDLSSRGNSQRMQCSNNRCWTSAIRSAPKSGRPG